MAHAGAMPTAAACRVQGRVAGLHGCAALLVPFPFATDDHQTRNGEYLVGAGAAEMIAESALTPERLADRLSALTADREVLLRMSEAARAAAWPRALDVIVSTLLQEARE